MNETTNQLVHAAGNVVAAAPSTWNAWHLVAALAGAIVVHVYHTVVNAGGYEMIWRRFRYGPSGKPSGPAAQAAIPEEKLTP